MATEFGRTAAVNGTQGPDHGTATMLIGGAVKGDRVIADWPGLAPSKLYQDRDLQATASFDTLIAGAAGASLGLDLERTARILFAQASGKAAFQGLVV